MIKKNLKAEFVLFSILIILSACKQNSTEPDQPKVTMNYASASEGYQSSSKISIDVKLSSASEKIVTITYSTEDSTAHSGSDYVAINDAQVVFNAGETSKTIEIEIIGDTLMEFTEQFILSVTQAENAIIDNKNFIINITDNDTRKPVLNSDGYDISSSYPGLTLQWQDEFNGSGLNESDWNYELGGGGWGNNELETYTHNIDNVFTDNGKLVIQAIDEGSGYSSGRLTTQNKQTFQFGLIDIRAKLPRGKGLWPALWMLGTNITEVNWPACGEIDIMELVGHQPNIAYGTAHYNQNGHQYCGGNYALSVNDIYADKFHIFSIFWENDRIVWYVDYNKFFEFDRNSVGSDWPFNNPFFFIFNVAVGGTWPGNPDDSTVFPQTLTVDYVRVYKHE